MAYAVLLSLTLVLEQTLNCDYQYLILSEKQQIASLFDEVSFLQDFLDNSSQKNIKTVECLESHIRDAAYKTEDIIESHMTDRVHEESASPTFFHKLEKVMEEIDSIKKMLEKIEDKSNFQDQQQQIRSMVTVGKSTVVGCDDDLL
ncbi:NBS-LRR class resistance protein Fy8-Ry8 [Abeliophyllum distichum]|uniref:NBS-LRR class resistance protein Fy8-Ry8 n=1 Tax=Abeliophyllum distichum TaxID=126358 RepID=A0ABD1V360_9LAMI